MIEGEKNHKKGGGGVDVCIRRFCTEYWPLLVV